MLLLIMPSSPICSRLSSRAGNRETFERAELGHRRRGFALERDIKPLTLGGNAGILSAIWIGRGGMGMDPPDPVEQEPVRCPAARHQVRWPRGCVVAPDSAS